MWIRPHRRVGTTTLVDDQCAGLGAAPLSADLGRTRARLTLVFARLRRRLHRLSERTPYVPNSTCPVCGSSIVVAVTTMPGTAYSGPMHSAATRDERVAACAEHGRSPLNGTT